MKLFFCATLTAIFLSACSSKPAKDAGANSSVSKTGKAQESKAVSMESKQLANEEETNLATEITFSRGKAFISDEAEIKKSLEIAGIPNTDTTVKVPGKASKSVVIFIMEEE